MKTTIFLPMTKGQAEWSFLNRTEAFRRGFDTLGGGVLVGYADRDAAIAEAAPRHIHPFALLRITFEHGTHELLTHFGNMRGDGSQWTVTPAGCAVLADPATVEMTMELLPGAYKLSEQQRVDVFSLPEGAGGPTGFGGC